MNHLLNYTQERMTRYVALLVITAFSMLALLPFLFNRASLEQLFWFGDDWDLLSQLQRQGLFPWIFSCFAENFVPVFKMLWIGSIKLTGGSYFVMLGILWATHAVIVLLFGFLLLRFKIGLPGLIFSILLLGISWTNIETLTWSIQWSASLSVLFFLAAFHILMSMLDKSRFDILHILLYAFCVLCSALSFSRGILSGGILAVFFLLTVWGVHKKAPLRIFTVTGASLLPSIVPVLIIYIFAAGNHQSILAYDWNLYIKMAEFGGAYFFLNPLAVLFHLPWGSWQNAYVFILFILLKITVFYFGLRLANSEQRRLIIVFLFMDLCNAVLLGLGRYHTGLSAAMSFRYQLISWICFGAPLAIALNHLLNKMFSSKRLLIITAVGLYLLITSYNLYCWRKGLPDWCHSRGVVARSLLAHPEKTEGMPGISFFNNHEADIIAKQFNLH